MKHYLEIHWLIVNLAQTSITFMVFFSLTKNFSRFITKDKIGFINFEDNVIKISVTSEKFYKIKTWKVIIIDWERKVYVSYSNCLLYFL